MPNLPISHSKKKFKKITTTVTCKCYNIIFIQLKKTFKYYDIIYIICLPLLHNGPVKPGGQVHPNFVHMYIPRHISAECIEQTPLQLNP